MNKSFCALPWLHVHPFPSGKVFPCCVSDNQMPVGDLSKNSLEEIIHSPEMNAIRSKMLRGENVENCMKPCIKREEVSAQPSKRKMINEFYKNAIPELITLTNEDGSFKNKNDFKMKHLNIRFSNLCNFKCRSCYSELSSLILQEEDPTKKVIHIDEISPNIMADVYKYLPDVDLIHFAGGETLLVDEHWHIMERLIELGKTDTHIVCTTNLSKITYKNKSIIDYMKKFTNFMLVVSIDAINERAELYRNGTVWETITTNLRTLVDSGVPFTTSCTVGATNIRHVPAIHKYLDQNNFIYEDRFFMNPITSPAYLSCRILPDTYKKEVTEEFNNYSSSISHKTNFNQRLQLLVNFMNSKDDSQLLPDFIKYHNMMDTRRYQNTFEVFPELKSLL